MTDGIPPNLLSFRLPSCSCDLKRELRTINRLTCANFLSGHHEPQHWKLIKVWLNRGCSCATWTAEPPLVSRSLFNTYRQVDDTTTTSEEGLGWFKISQDGLHSDGTWLLYCGRYLQIHHPLQYISR